MAPSSCYNIRHRARALAWRRLSALSPSQSMAGVNELEQHDLIDGLSGHLWCSVLCAEEWQCSQPGEHAAWAKLVYKSIAWLAGSHNVNQLFYFKLLRLGNF